MDTWAGADETAMTNILDERTVLLAKQDRAIATAQRAIAPAVKASVLRHTANDATLTPMAYWLILRDVSTAHAPVFGRFRGDRNQSLYRTVVATAWAAWRVVIGRAVVDIERRTGLDGVL